MQTESAVETKHVCDTSCFIPTPSSHHRISQCMVSEVLPHVEESESGFARKGTIAHKFFSDCLTVGREQALLDADVEDAEWLSAIPVEFLPASMEGFVPEVSFAYSPETEASRVLGRNLERANALTMLRHGEMLLTIDIHCIELRDGTKYVVVFDYKTGRGFVEPSRSNWQTWDYLLAACRAYGIDQGRQGIIRVSDSGYIEWDSFEVDAFALDQHAANLRKLLRKRRDAKADPEGSLRRLKPKLGDHCRYCPAIDSCPTTRTVLQGITRPGSEGSIFSAFELELIHPLTQTDKAQAYRYLKHADIVTARAWKHLDSSVSSTGPVDLGDGYVYGPKAGTEKTIVPDQAVPALLEMFGPELGPLVVEEAVETKTSITKAALERALRSVVLPTRPEDKITWLKTRTLEELEERRAMRVVPERPILRYKKKDEDAH